MIATWEVEIFRKRPGMHVLILKQSPRGTIGLGPVRYLREASEVGDGNGEWP